MERKYRVTATIVLVLLIVSVAFLRLGVRQPEVRFSEKRAFQEKAFYLTLGSGIFGGTIYYTLDGNNPTLDSKVYTEPILIEEGLPNKVTVVKAARLQGKELGEVYTQTYFVGEGVSKLYDVMLVSLSADSQV